MPGTGVRLGARVFSGETTVGWAALYQSTAIVIYGVCVWTGFQLFVLLYEEPHLRKVFGDAYTRYCSSVGRWLTIPINRFN